MAITTTAPANAVLIYELKRKDALFYIHIDNRVLMLTLKYKAHPWYLEILDLFKKDKVCASPLSMYVKEGYENSIPHNAIPIFNRVGDELTNFQWLGNFLKSKHPNAKDRTAYFWLTIYEAVLFEPRDRSTGQILVQPERHFFK